MKAGSRPTWRASFKGNTAMAMSAADIERFIREALPDAVVTIRDLGIEPDA